MKNNKMIRIKIIYSKCLFKIYSVLKNILPHKIRNKLKKYIEIITLNNSKEVYRIIESNKIIYKKK